MLALILAVSACGVVGGLPPTSTATCTQDSDCTIPFCPNQCNGGQPACSAGKAYGVEEARQACPCIDTPNADYCHPTGSCPLYDCPVFAIATAFCRSSHCVALLPDGGALP